MQATNVRYGVLIVVLLLGAGLHTLLGNQPRATTPRWPAADEVFSVGSWSVGPAVVDNSSGHTDLVSRVVRSSAGASGTLTLVASRAPKLYAAGAEVPFLGNGLAVEPASSDLVGPEEAEIGSLIARRGTERWLVLFAYGERRGLLGNGGLAWATAFVDGVLGQPNDYYKLYLMVRSDNLDESAQREVVDLARGLFPRIAAWYAA